MLKYTLDKVIRLASQVVEQTGEVSTFLTRQTMAASAIKHKAVLSDCGGVIFKRPWDDVEDQRVTVSVWDLLFKRLGIYNEHERLKEMFKARKFGYCEWTDQACRVLKKNRLNESTFHGVIGSLNFEKGVRQLHRYLKARGVKTGLITGGFYELAERAMKELRINTIMAHCRLCFGRSGILESWEIERTDYLDKPRCLRGFCSEEGIAPRQVAYLGDNVNDLSIFRQVGLAIAFNSDKPAVQKAANIVVNSDDCREIIPHLVV